MRREVIWKAIFWCFIACLAASCGGGGGGGDNGNGVGDTAPPVVVSTDPVDGAASVDVHGAISVTFNEPIDPASVTAATFTLTSAAGAAAGAASLVDKVATFTPSAALDAFTLYTATATTGVKDLAGNALAADFSWTFTTRGQKGWGTAVFLEDYAGGDAFSPGIGIDAGGNALVAWYQSVGPQAPPPEYDLLSKRFIAGSGWEAASTPVTATKAWGTTFLPVPLAVDAAGEAIALSTNNVVLSFWSNSFLPGVGWGGDDPTIDGAPSSVLYSRIVMTADGQALAVWARGTAMIRASTASPGAAWAPAVRIDATAGTVDTPDLAVNASGDAIAVWEEWSAGQTYAFISASRYDAASGTWGAPVKISTDDSVNAQAPRVAIDPAGNAIAIWLHSNASGGYIAANRFSVASGWQASETQFTLSAGWSPQIAMDPAGNAIAVWYDDLGRMWARRYDAIAGWQPAVDLRAATQQTYNPAIAMDPQGNAMVVWEQLGGSHMDVWANFYDAAAGKWGTAVHLETDDAGDANTPQVAMDAQGNAIAVWHQADASGQLSVWANRFE